MKANEKAFLWRAILVPVLALALGLEYIMLFSVAGRWPIF